MFYSRLWSVPGYGAISQEKDRRQLGVLLITYQFDEWAGYTV